jgi:hypothetical protein
MLRKTAFAAMTTLGLALPLGLNSTAQAYPGVVICRPVYTVMYFGPHHHWHCFGTYASRWDAEHAAHHLRHEGFAVRIEVR